MVADIGRPLRDFAWPGSVRGAGDEPVATQLTWGAAALISLCYYFSQSAWLAGLGFWTLYRPLVGGMLVGIILGDPAGGVRAGATINLAYLGFIATGGTLPTDISLAGYVGTALVLAGGLDESAALALTVPAGMLGYLIYQLRMTADVVFVHWADRFAARGDARGVAMCNVVPPQVLLLLLSAIPCFLAVYYGPAWLGQVLAGMPSWLLPGLTLIGGMLPALGIAMTLRFLWRGVNGAYFLLTFVLCSLAQVPMLALGVMAAAVATIHVHVSRGAWSAQGRAAMLSSVKETSPAPSDPQPDQDGNRATTQALRMRDLVASWLNWLFFSHACYNFERMQGTGFAHAMCPVLRRLYPDRQRLAKALERHTVYYNSEPNLGALVNGIAVALEEARSQGKEVSEETIQAAKAGLMGPISGLGDTLIQGSIAPTLLSVGVGLALEGNLAGPLLYILLMATVVWGVGWIAFLRGYREGSSQVATMLQRGVLRQVRVGIEIVGSSLLGALAAGLVQLRTPVVLQVGQAALRLQEDVLDKLFPQALPLAVVLLYLFLLRRRVSPGWLVGGTFVLGIGARILGLL